MFPDFKLKRIEVYSNFPLANELIFEWDFKEVNFLFGANNAGKTTLFHIIKDILGNPNSGGAGVKGGSILTQDLALKDISAVLHFSIGSHIFKTEKSYSVNGKQRFFQLEGTFKYIGTRDSFIEFIESEDILSVPHIKYKDKEKLTLFSIMRLCFIEQDGGFGIKNKIAGHKNSASIIKHMNDGRTKILFYAYILGIIQNEDRLNSLYVELGKLSDIENELETVLRNIKIITGDSSVGEGGGLFDIYALVKEVQELHNKIRKLDISNFNYIKLLEKFNQLHKYNLQASEINEKNESVGVNIEKNESVETFLRMLELDIESINLKILQNKESIAMFTQKVVDIEERIKAGENFILEEFVLKMRGLSIDGGEQGTFQALKVREQELRNSRADLMDVFNAIKDGILSNEKYLNFIDFIYGTSQNYFSNETLSLALDEGRYYFSTTADSLNRIALFNILTSFLLLKNTLNIQHPNFIVFDSPFVGVNKEHETSAIFNFLQLYETASSGQYFVFLNPEDFDVELKASLKEKEYVSILNCDSKVFNITI